MPADRILVVDDNLQNLKLARLVLQADGYEVHTAQDAEEALVLIDRVSPWLILMDLQLPRMDGLELTRKLKADPSHNAVVIVAWTAYAMKGDEEKARAAGCDAYVTKPIDIDRLSQVVATQFDRVHKRREQV